ncbi:hypothetical protein [Deinococcus sp. LM3]|uniref:hypothetical protein n=1 Tax=Deinococcus sp. LM3 TaxID=1938608 RepID=UPI00099197FA|nr:hypothetical protein [Deinococcus sp. LM3]OOV11804.1 hypothetical protein BXU09_19550 [Deinococcus sp. LM3]
MNANPILAAAETLKDGLQKMVDDSGDLESVTLSSGGQSVTLTSARDRAPRQQRPLETHDHH